MSEEQKEYNELLQKIDKAVNYMENNIKHPSIQQMLFKFQTALDRTNELIKIIENQLDREMTKEEIYHTRFCIGCG